MKAQERFNVRSAPWIELQRPNIANDRLEGILVAFEGRDAQSDNPRLLHMTMSPLESLDFAARLIRAALKTQPVDSDANGSLDLSATGKLLLRSQQTFLEGQLKHVEGDIGRRMIRNELKKIAEELAQGQYQVSQVGDNSPS